MDLKLKGRTAIVCGASKGLGRACAEQLAGEGVELVIAARTENDIQAAAADIMAQTGTKVIGVAADVVTPEGRAAILSACPEPDILINNAGGPPPGDFRSWERDDWIAALDANMLSAIELIRATIDPMMDRKWGRIINITSGMVKQPVGSLGLSNGARSGLTGFVGGLSREVAASGVTVNNLLPGAFDTDRLRQIHQRFAKLQGSEVAVVAETFKNQVPMKRFGTPEEFGATCAFLCSEHAGFMTGQNILMDGGSFPGLF